MELSAGLFSEGRHIEPARWRRMVAQRALALQAAGLPAGGILRMHGGGPLDICLNLFAARRLGAALLPLPASGGHAPAGGWLWKAARPCLEPLPGLSRLPGIGLLIATSGSSGRPRLVAHTDAALDASARTVAAVLGLRPGDRWLQCLPLQHIGGLSILLRCAHAGAAPILTGPFSVERVAEALREQAPTHVSLVPAMLWRLLEAGVPRPSSLRVALLGGQALSPAVARRAHQAGWPLCVSYGATETASAIALECGPRAGLEAGRVGRPLPGVRLTLAGDGRIALRAPQLMAGEVDAAGGFQALADGAELRMPDLGEWLPDGGLCILGRADEVVVSGGINIHPARVEARLQAIEALGEVAVSAVPDPVWGQRLVLFYTGRLTPAEAARHCRDHLDSAHRPRVFRRLERIPSLPSGKPDRQRLRALAEAGVTADP